MKKFAFVAFVAVLVFMFAAPAMAIDNIFGGYWRTRAYMQQDFTGYDCENSNSKDTTQVDTRTRLYYTAKFSDNFKFINKFEMDAVWGATRGSDGHSDTSGYGDIGADGIKVEVKNSYADFTVGPMNFKVGVQYLVFSRGFLFADDAAAAVITYNGDGFSVPFTWIKAYEGGTGYNGTIEDERNEFDVDYYALAPSFSLGNVAMKPFVLWITSEDAEKWDGPTDGFGQFDLWYLGADIDAKFGDVKAWFTGIYATGSADDKITAHGGSAPDYDLNGYLLAVGVSAPVGPVEVHGQFFTASGDDGTNSQEIDAFWVPDGQSYYWSEIMGLGIFDNQASSHSCADAISNIMAINAGVTYQATPKLTFTGDLWYAKLNEDDSNGETNLGTEIDLKASYKIMDNLNLDIVAAYLFTGDATYKKTGSGAPDQEDAYEIGTQLSLSF